MHPLVALLASHVVLSLASLLPASSSYRSLVVVIILINCAISLGSVDARTWWSEQFALYVCGVGLYTNYQINIRKLAAPPNKSRFQKLRWALERCFDSRSGIAIEDLPSFRVGDPQYVPPKAMFLKQRIWTLAWTVSGYVFFTRYPLVYYLDDFQSPKHQIIRRLADVSYREWMIMIHTAFTGWFMLYCALSAIHSFLAVIAVACGDVPGHWRPLFGDIREAYSVQRFFG